MRAGAGALVDIVARGVVRDYRGVVAVGLSAFRRAFGDQSHLEVVAEWDGFARVGPLEAQLSVSVVRSLRDLLLRRRVALAEDVILLVQQHFDGGDRRVRLANVEVADAWNVASEAQADGVHLLEVGKLVHLAVALLCGLSDRDADLGVALERILKRGCRCWQYRRLAPH